MRTQKSSPRLPSENPEELGLPDEFQALQPQLLHRTCRPAEVVRGMTNGVKLAIESRSNYASACLSLPLLPHPPSLLPLPPPSPSFSPFLILLWWHNTKRAVWVLNDFAAQGLDPTDGNLTGAIVRNIGKYHRPGADLSRFAIRIIG